MEMFNSKETSLSALCEQVLINVDLQTRKSVEYPDWARSRIKNILTSFEKIDFPEKTGASIGLRKK